jgi:glycosyltransferase involved in cell wall biosynthesis
MTPFFSIILPTYNRASLIRRAIESCLTQSFGDFEVLVIDDGSTDESSEMVLGCADQRVRLIRHDRNRGVSPARNSGMAMATSRWFVFLDSDDELLPEALSTMYARAQSVDADVVGMRFMCMESSGRLSPTPALKGQRWDYEGYLRWLDEMRGLPSETLPCARASTFPTIQWPNDYSLEALYHLNLARAGSVCAYPDVVRAYHNDAGDQLTVPNRRRSLMHAADAANNVEIILREHGVALRRVAPGVYRDLLRGGALLSFLAGRRRSGLAYSRMYLAEAPQSPLMYAIVAAGLVDRRILAWVQEKKGQLQRG